MFLTYSFVSVSAYSLRGAAAPAYLMEVLDYGGTRALANFLMFVHIGISYVGREGRGQRAP